MTVELINKRSLTWDRLIFIVIVTMILSLLVGLFITTNFGYFRPPVLRFTNYIFLFAWIPIFILGILARPTGNPRRALITLIIVGFTTTIIGMVLLGPHFNYTSGTCDSAPLTDQPVRYECTITNYQNNQTSYVLVGRENWLFVLPENEDNE